MGEGAEPITRLVVKNVRTLRQRRRWSAQRLVDEMAAHGHTMTRSVIANREGGRTGGVTVDDLVGFAKAFGMAPQDLLAELPAVVCEHCADEPPPGFSCNACGAGRGTPNRRSP
jgi:transcriptional regulator with XRE-family HTH domain